MSVAGGTEFWKVFFDEAQKLDGVQFLAQGTIYPGIISLVLVRPAARLQPVELPR